MISRRKFLLSTLSAVAIGGLVYANWPELDVYRDEVRRQREALKSDPELADFVRMATLAANGHNTQPWRFAFGDQSVSIFPDLTRRTEVVDPDDHHLYVSLGCAAENFLVSAGAHKRSADTLIHRGSDTTIEIFLRPGSASNEELFDAIPYRQSTRSQYDGRSVSPQVLRELKRVATDEGVELLLFTGASELREIEEFVVAGNTAQMDNPAFIAELDEWLRFSPERALATKDGMFAVCSGNPVMPDWLGQLAFKALFKKDSENKKYREQIRSSSGVAVFVGAKEDPEHWIKVGRSFQRFALKATTLGLRTAHINQPIEVAGLRSDFAKWLGVPGARPDLVVRFGRAPALPMSLRRPVSEVLL